MRMAGLFCRTCIGRSTRTGSIPKPDSLGRALAAARRAVEIAPSNHLAYHALATAHFLRREFPAFRSAADRAIELNPMDGFTMAYLGSLFAYSGDWERGCAMQKQARDLNPRHPSWYWFSDCFDAYRRGDYRAALDIARKIQMPGFWRLNLALAAAHGQLGESRRSGGSTPRTPRGQAGVRVASAGRAFEVVERRPRRAFDGRPAQGGARRTGSRRRCSAADACREAGLPQAPRPTPSCGSPRLP